MPTRVKENTIALITTSNIGEIFYQIDKPVSANINDIWIFMNSSYRTLDFNMNNTLISLGYFGAYIKTADDWISIESWKYQNKEWRFLWSGQLIDGATQNLYDDYTAWGTKGILAVSGSGADKSAPVITFENEMVVADTDTKSGDTSGIYYTTQKIDLTPYKTIVFEGNFKRGGTVERNFMLGVWTSIGTYYTSNLAAYKYMPSTTGTVIKLDISSINQSCHIGLGLVNSLAKISKAYLVPKGEL